MAFSTSRTEALMRIKGTIKVQSIFSPFYNVSVLQKYSDLNDKSNQSKLNKFLKEYKSKYEKQLSSTEAKQSIKSIKEALEFKSKTGNKQFETFTLKQLGLLDYSDCENDIFKIIKDDETLLVLPDYTESDDTFEDYIKKTELKKSVSKGLEIKYERLPREKKEMIKNQTFLLKVMTRNKKSTESMKTSVSEALEELDKYLQGRLYDEANRSSRNGASMNRTIKKIIFFTDNEGKWSLHHFDAKKYNKSIVQILSDSFDAYIKESRSKKDDSIGIQIKQMEKYGKAGVRIPSYFKMSFKEVYREKGENRNIQNYNILEFEHFVLTEELKGTFDPAYIKSYSVDDADAKSVFEVIYKYNIETDKDPYFFEKIVINKNKTYILDIKNIPSFIISGYFQGRSKNYKFKITRVESNDIIDPDLDFSLLFMTKYAFSYNNIINNKIYDYNTLILFFSPLIDDKKAIKSFIIRETLKEVISNETYKFLLPQKKPQISYDQIDENISSIIDSLNKEQIVEILQNIDNNYSNENQAKMLDDLISMCVERYFLNLIFSKGVNQGELLYDLLKLNQSLQMKVFKKKGDDIHNFKVLGKKNDENSSIEYLQGVLKEYEPNTYYKIFSTNLIDTNLNPKRQINYYDDMKITEQNFQAFLLSKSPNSNREKSFSLEKELLLVLTDTSLLNDYYNFVSEEFPDDVLDEGSSYLSISEIEEFKYEVLKGIIDIIFHVGTSFYVSNISSKNTTNKVTTRGFSSYEISNIDDIIIISQYNDPPFDDEGVVIDYFVDGKVKKEFNQRSNNTQQQSRSLVVSGEQSNIPVAQDEIIRESYIDPKFYSYKEYEKTINTMKTEHRSGEDLETRSLVVLHFDLLYHKDVDKKSNCASRKKRITKKVNELFSNFKAYMRSTTRYLKPKIKNSKGGGTKKIKK